jgi:hypothetical protein
MSYEIVLKKAGYDVIAINYFGSYSGEWAAILRNGEVILGPFGSCSYCDELSSYTSKPEDLSEEQCKKFCEEAGYETSKDYRSLITAEKWNSNSFQRINWLKNKLIELEFMAEGEIEDENS